ncbi:helix-turn-helix domain-containing protein [Fructilactobacillus frigidiflavus]|uniref:helix-turn-helix domain-containing protein n=1 Tax=Fructilactobacillus frigidiflavus TaxID=3242688 RepID=UPI003757BE36
MDFKINGSRIREARQFRRLTITQLSEKLGISKQMVSKYERNISQPSLDVFKNIVKELKFPLRYFTNEDISNYKDEGTFYRSRLSASKSEKRPTETLKKATGIIEDYFAKYVDFPKLEKIDIDISSPRLAARYLRDKWNLGDKPISNMLTLLESHGIVVTLIDSKSEKVDAQGGFVSVKGNNYYIVILDPTNTSFYREQFSLAHELGHFVLHSLTVDVNDVDPISYRKIEKEADDFASNFLLPEKSFKNDIIHNKSNLEFYMSKLKYKWNVSGGSMIHRARDLSIINANEYVKLQKKISYKRWRKSEPFDNNKSLMKPELLKQAFILLKDNDLLDPVSLGTNIDHEYGFYYPNEILSEIIGIDISNFRSKPIHLKIK